MEKLIPLNEQSSKFEPDEHQQMVLDFIARLIHSVGAVHIMHLNTRSYAVHKALDEYYKEMPELIDSFAEAYLGLYPYFKIPSRVTLDEYLIPRDLIKGLTEGMDHMREMLTPEVINPLEDVLTQINHTLYKLEFV